MLHDFLAHSAAELKLPRLLPSTVHFCLVLLFDFGLRIHPGQPEIYINLHNFLSRNLPLNHVDAVLLYQYKSYGQLGKKRRNHFTLTNPLNALPSYVIPAPQRKA